jgi:hypothetical protein
MREVHIAPLGRGCFYLAPSPGFHPGLNSLHPSGMRGGKEIIDDDTGMPGLRGYRAEVA